MSKTPYTSTYFGIDRAVVEAAVQRAHRERSEAFRSLLRSILGSRTAKLPELQQSSSRAGTPAHC